MAGFSVNKEVRKCNSYIVLGTYDLSNEFVPRILGIVEAPIDGFEALSPLELGEPQVVEEQVVVVLVQVEARLEKGCNQVSFEFDYVTETMLTILNVAFVGHSIIECMFLRSRY